MRRDNKNYWRGRADKVEQSMFMIDTWQSKKEKRCMC